VKRPEVWFGLGCPVCGGELDAPGVCTACREEIFPEQRGGGVYLARYGKVRRLVHAVKYRGNRAALTWAAGRLSARVEQAGWPVAVVTYVPTFFWRALARGGHAPRELARGISRELGLPFQSLLFRARYTKSQLVRKERKKLPQVFRARGRVKGAVLLVDDVYTTGATFARAAEVLLEAGAEKVYGAFLAVSRPELLSRLPYTRREGER